MKPALLLSLLVVCGCSSRQPAAQLVDRLPTRAFTTTDTVPMEEAGSASVDPLPPRVAGLRLIPDSVVLRVGDTLDLRTVQVLVVDSAGGTVRRLRFYNHGSPPGAIRMVQMMRVAAAHPGTGVVGIEVPAFQWQVAGRPAPRAELRVIVRER
jgi:hypothetical protein